MDLYCKGRPSKISNFGELRWFLFSKYQTESIRLPSTIKAFEQAIQGAHFTNLQWKSSHIASPNLPDPCDFGWKWDDAHKVYQPILTKNLPAPECIIEISSRKCKTGCNSGRCRCHKNSLVCSEMFLCQNMSSSYDSGSCYCNGNLSQTPEVEITVDHINISKGFEPTSHQA